MTEELELTVPSNESTELPRKIKIDLNDQQKEQKRLLEIEIDSLETERNALRDQLNHYLEEKQHLCHVMGKPNNIPFELSASQKMNQFTLMCNDSEALATQDLATWSDKANATVFISELFADLNRSLKNDYERVKRQLFENNKRDRGTGGLADNRIARLKGLMESLVPLVEFQPVHIPVNSNIYEKSCSDSIELIRCLQIVEKCVSRAEPIQLKAERCEILLQLISDRVNYESQLIDNSMLAMYCDVAILKRLIGATSSLFSSSAHTKVVWPGIINNGLLDSYLNLLSCDKVDMGVVFKVMKLFQDVTSCENDSQKFNTEKARYFHRWFQTGRAVSVLIKMLQTMTDTYDNIVKCSSLQSPSPSINRERFSVSMPKHDNSPSICATQLSDNSSIRHFKQHYHIMFSLLNTLWNLSRSNTLQLYIKNSIGISSYRETLEQFPVTLSRSFDSMPQTMNYYFEPIHVLELQKLILKISANVCVDVPEYIILSSKLHMDRQFASSLNNAELFFDSIFSFVSFSKSPYQKPSEVNALTCTLMYNIVKPTSDPDKLIRCIQTMSLILKEELVNKRLKDAVISQCHRLFKGAKQCEELLYAIKNAHTTIQMQNIGSQIVVRKGNEPIMDQVKRKCIDYLSNNQYVIPTDATLVEDVIAKRRSFRLPPSPQVVGGPHNGMSSSFVNLQGSRTPNVGKRSSLQRSPLQFQSERKQSLAPTPRVFALNHHLAVSSKARKKLSFSEMD